MLLTPKMWAFALGCTERGVMSEIGLSELLCLLATWHSSKILSNSQEAELRLGTWRRSCAKRAWGPSPTTAARPIDVHSYYVLPGCRSLLDFSVEYPNQIPSSKRLLQPNKIPDDTEVEGKTFQAYSMPDNRASLGDQPCEQ
jgi:hypothetical protein